MADGVRIVCYGDNVAYLLHGPGTDACVVIDPGHADAVRQALQKHTLRPELILATHGHGDHTAGAAELVRSTGAFFSGPPRATEESEIRWSGGRLRVLPVPGHTRTHVAFYDPDRRAVFTGDALFVAGCGRLMECEAGTMWRSLMRLLELPETTRVYPGHDYTADNLAFAAHLDPADTAVAERWARARSGDALVPSTIGEERRTNPFLRCADPAFRIRIGLDTLSAEACFAELRGRKDQWG